jgi:Na+/melibiose symporter-like transporter
MLHAILFVQKHSFLLIFILIFILYKYQGNQSGASRVFCLGNVIAFVVYSIMFFTFISVKQVLQQQNVMKQEDNFLPAKHNS